MTVVGVGWIASLSLGSARNGLLAGLLAPVSLEQLRPSIRIGPHTGGRRAVGESDGVAEERGVQTGALLVPVDAFGDRFAEHHGRHILDEGEPLRFPLRRRLGVFLARGIGRDSGSPHSSVFRWTRVDWVVASALRAQIEEHNATIA